MSDTHLCVPPAGVPDGDVLVHAGDITLRGAESETEHALHWLDRLPHAHKLVIAGNHDFLFEGRAPRARELMATHPTLTYLQDTGVAVRGLKFWGTPWQPWFYDWAFNLRRGPAIREKWDLIPTDTDVQIVHGPPAGWMDRNSDGQECGCIDLLAPINRITPRLVVFGHIHESCGQAQLVSKRRRIQLVNASICDAYYHPTKPAYRCRHQLTPLVQRHSPSTQKSTNCEQLEFVSLAVKSRYSSMPRADPKCPYPYSRTPRKYWSTTRGPPSGSSHGLRDQGLRRTDRQPAPDGRSVAGSRRHL